MKDTDYLFLTSMLRAREAKMLSSEKIERMLDAGSYDDCAKLLPDFNYPDLSGMSGREMERVLSNHRQQIFTELANNSVATKVTDIFRIKYDYHNIKVLVKSMGANVDASNILSESGRIDSQTLTEAFITGERRALPVTLSACMGAAVGILSRTSNPQLADIFVDKAYFEELSALVNEIDDEFISGYLKLYIDSTNLRIYVRSARSGRDSGFLKQSLIPGGTVDIDRIAELVNSVDGVVEVFSVSLLERAVRLAPEVCKGGSQTEFELECDNAVFKYVTESALISFGAAPLFTYLSRLEWEIMVLRMILTGKLTGIAPEQIRERLRGRDV